ncbi:MAG TPA: hypothetical protein PL155_02465 [Candidatus Omnitrophota bacterium]|nr:hypothetical protein [Candidatus Omnitrophota bacterium]HPD84651.1 hypothetical protein [Candidatus Omnitrophota bacterium]HRZ03509.1 hypothetical protein [Candidatus Omnitrophota bacterium]
MDIFFTVVMYVMWAVSLAGILIITFSNFQYLDLNIIVGVFFLLTLVNTLFRIGKKI